MLTVTCFISTTYKKQHGNQLKQHKMLALLFMLLPQQNEAGFYARTRLATTRMLELCNITYQIMHLQICMQCKCISGCNVNRDIEKASSCAQHTQHWKMSMQALNKMKNTYSSIYSRIYKVETCTYIYITKSNTQCHKWDFLDVLHTRQTKHYLSWKFVYIQIYITHGQCPPIN